jgi:hypothetical protein
MKIKSIILIVTALQVLGCGNSSKKPDSVETIAQEMQGTVFKSLLQVTGSSRFESNINDSMAFLVLPIQASCPACRKKTIDSIIARQKDLLPNHFIIISAKAGLKKMNAYFAEQGYELPVLENKLFLDSLNDAFKLGLYEDKPTVYYTFGQKAYKKVAALPATVRKDLREFFSGTRINRTSNKN